MLQGLFSLREKKFFERISNFEFGMPQNRIIATKLREIVQRDGDSTIVHALHILHFNTSFLFFDANSGATSRTMNIQKLASKSWRADVRNPESS